MKVFVTGETGFVGRRVVALLLEHGHQVQAPPRAQFDVLDPAGARASLGGAVPDAIVHLAWIATPGTFWEDGANLDWVAGSLQLLRAAQAAGVPTFVGAGTCAEYAWSGGMLTERSPAVPATLYGAAKHAFAELGERNAAASGMRFAWGRIFFPYGSGEPGEKFVTRVAQTVRRGGSFEVREPARQLDYLHVDDVASALVVLLERGDARGAYNIASGAPRVMGRFAREIADIARSNGAQLVLDARQPVDAPDVIASVERLQQLGWSPAVLPPQGIAETIGERRR